MKRLAQLVRNRWVLSIAAALVLYTAAGFLLIPYLFRHSIPQLAAERLGCQATLAEARFNPFLFEFEAKGFSFKDTSGKPVFGFQRLFVDFELESLFRWAWTFADIRLEGMSLSLIIDQGGRLNLVKIADAWPESKKPSPSGEGPLRILLNHMVLADGSVRFIDRSKPTPVSETVHPIDLEFDAISTLPEHRGSHTASAKLPDGAVVKWKGEVSLNPILSEGEVRLDGFKLATPWSFIRDRLNLTEPSGEADARAHYRFRSDPGRTELSMTDAGVKVTGLRLARVSALEPILALEAIEIGGASFDLASREVKVSVFNVHNGHLAVSVDETGIANWESLVKPEVPSGAPPPAASTAQAPWRVKVEAFKLTNVGIGYADASHAIPSVLSVGAFQLQLGAELETGGGAPKARIRDLAVHLERIALAAKGDALASLDSIAVAGGRVDLEKREATIEQVSLQGGGVTLVRDANRSIRLLEVFGPRGQRQEIDVAQNREEAGPWRFGLKALNLQGFRVVLADRSVAPGLAYDVEDMKLALKDITNDGQTPIAFEARLKIKQGGALSTVGKLSQRGDRAGAQIEVTGVDLKPLQALVGQLAALKLESARVSAKMRVDYRRAETAPSLKVAGALRLDKLLLKESKNGKPFLSCKALSADGIDFSLGPDKLSIKEVRLTEPATTIIIFKDQTVNLASVFQRASSSGQGPAPTQAHRRAPPLPVAVERVRIEKAEVDFADLSLVIPFAVRIHDFGGAVTGISSAPASQTRIRLEGRVDEYGQVNVEGSLSPLQLESFSDVKVVFRNVAMPPLSPYSGTFAGRRIKSGKLNLDLEYRVADHRLKSNSTIVLDQFTLGEPIESERAVSLPLDLAIALLTDREGKINASVPIEGDMDHPEFSFGHLIWQALVNLITDAVTAPFRALGSLVGGEEESLEAIRFQPGSDTIPPPEREKLAKTAEALTKRPMIKLTVHGAYDPGLDGTAIRSLQVRRALAQKLEIDLQPAEDPGPVAFDNAKTQRALEALSAEGGGADAMEEFQASYEKSRGRKPQRVGAILALMGQASEEREFYEQLFQHLVETTPLATAALEALATRRGTAVIRELTGEGGSDPLRATAGPIEQVSDTEADTVPIRLEPGPLGTP